MEYAQQAQDARSLRGIGGPTPTPQRTLAARLESATSTIAAQAGRIEDVLAKINGTPRGGQKDAPEKISTALPLATSVENAEFLAKRLCDLASNLEQVA